MKNKETVTHIMPSLWASAIMNYDYTGLENIDKIELNTYLLNNGISFTDCLSCSEQESMNTFNGILCMTLEYTYEK